MAALEEMHHLIKFIRVGLEALLTLQKMQVVNRVGSEALHSPVHLALQTMSVVNRVGSEALHLPVHLNLQEVQTRYKNGLVVLREI